MDSRVQHSNVSPAGTIRHQRYDSLSEHSPSCSESALEASYPHDTRRVSTNSATSVVPSSSHILQEHNIFENSRSEECIPRYSPSIQPSHLVSNPEPRIFESNHQSRASDAYPFRRWMRSLKRSSQAPLRRNSSDYKEALDGSHSPESSLRFVTAVRSATVTLASTSIATVSRKAANLRRGTRTSFLSSLEPRSSIDERSPRLDEAAKQRSRKRREKLEELIRTEESFVADMKALSDAYSVTLGELPTSESYTTSSTQATISQILLLHDEILGQLHALVPFAEYDQKTACTSENVKAKSHTRWHSIDVLPSRTTPARSILGTVRDVRRSFNLSRSSEDEPLALYCSPEIVQQVAQMFLDHMPRFSAYDQYAANFESLQRSVDGMQKETAAWEEYNRAIELLAAHVNPIRTWHANSRKAMTVKDLLIKPIQRIPRYALLFSDLGKLTPVYDSPDASAVLEELGDQLHVTCRRIDEAKDKPSLSKSMETTWMIGDRLTFSSQVPRSIFLQLLGQVQLCGCLHIAYRGKERIQGFYVICILFESTLVLASANEDRSKYSVLVGIALSNATIEEADNGKGLQCYTAPYSWKIVFEHSAHMYEFVVTACSAIEADTWRSNLQSGIDARTRAVNAGIFELHSPLTADMRSIGKAFGKPSSFVRRMSVHRAATVGPITNFNQVIIKNTQAVKEIQDPSSLTSLQIPRSQSVVTPSHVQTLRPRRASRHRLETLLADVWTRDALPYPGMVRRSDPIRASANHVIRKFSMATITSNFSSKRTASSSSINVLRRRDDDSRDIRHTSQPHNLDASRITNIPLPHPSTSRKPAVNFHTAPDAFLPADFQIPGPATKRKPSTFRSFTTAIERPFTPLLGTSSEQQRKLPPPRRTHSVPNNIVAEENLVPERHTLHYLSHPPFSSAAQDSSLSIQSHPLNPRPNSAHPPPSTLAALPSQTSPATPPPSIYTIKDRAPTPVSLRPAPDTPPNAKRPRGKSMLSRLFA